MHRTSQMSTAATRVGSRQAGPGSANETQCSRGPGIASTSRPLFPNACNWPSRLHSTRAALLLHSEQGNCHKACKTNSNIRVRISDMIKFWLQRVCTWTGRLGIKGSTRGILSTRGIIWTDSCSSSSSTRAGQGCNWGLVATIGKVRGCRGSRSCDSRTGPNPEGTLSSQQQ